MNRKHSEHHTRRHRLDGVDYSDPGYYFVTFATKDRRPILGTIDADMMELSPTGRKLFEQLESLATESESFEIDCFAIMPDHVHLLLYHFIDQPPVSVSEVIRFAKGRSAASHRKITGDRFGLWQNGFYDEIIRDERHLDAVRRYIVENPLRWRLDRDDP